MKRKVTLCCDDAGWNEANDQLMLELAVQGRISAISLVSSGVNAPAWRDYPINRRICSLGLHFNLTWQLGKPSQGLLKLMLKSFSGQLIADEIAQQIVRQLKQFEQRVGRPPDFVDGHQHVHMFPAIRQVLLQQLKQRYGNELPAIRAPYSQVWRGSKAQILNLLGAKQLYTKLNKQQWRCNHDFAGAYDFSVQYSYANRMQSWLAKLKNDSLIMAHPGALNEVEHSAARVNEANFFFSNQWLEQLDQQQIELVPFINSNNLS